MIIYDRGWYEAVFPRNKIVNELKPISVTYCITNLKMQIKY
jgi:hypothetical protein